MSPSLPRIKTNHKGLISASKRPNKSSSASNLHKERLQFMVSNQMHSEELAVLHSHHLRQDSVYSKKEDSIYSKKEEAPFIRQV